VPERVFKVVRAVLSSLYHPEAYDLNVWVQQYLSVRDELGPLEVTMTGICFNCETHI
jgi:hypothetical protein